MRHKFSTRLRRRKKFRQKTLTNVALFFMAVVPIYPVFGSYMQSYTGVIVRGDIDKSTILASYDWETGENTEYADSAPETTLIAPETLRTVPEPEIQKQEDTPKLPVDPKRSLYVTHNVVSGDTLSTIAEKYNIPVGTLRSMNALTTDLLRINQKIVIPRINGVQYTVQKGDSLSGIAGKYGIKDTDTIRVANDMSPNTTLSVGRKLLLPNPTKDPNKPLVPPTSKPTPTQVAADTAKKPATVTPSPKPALVPPAKAVAVVKKNAPDPATITYGDYTLSLKVEKGCRSFVWGNCTCFVAKYKNVNWRGNAKDWLKNAKKKGVPTGDDPKPGAIIVYHGPGFPPAYGHVGIVMEVNENDMIIKDMNYQALNVVTTRKESFTNPAIIGYIYVD